MLFSGEIRLGFNAPAYSGLGRHDCDVQNADKYPTRSCRLTQSHRGVRVTEGGGVEECHSILGISTDER
jgi:hypothetical protein